MFWSILDATRQAALPKLEFCRQQGFYLAGGTALALQLGHRDSVDFDFFRSDSFETSNMFDLLQTAFAGNEVVKVQDERDTITVMVEEVVKLSFMTYPYPLLRPLVDAGPFQMADIIDIGCMKLSAITGRAAMKDYVDMYFILQQVPLSELLEHCEMKLPRLDRALILKSLVFFGDIEEEPILYTDNNHVKFPIVKKFLQAQAAKVY